MKNLKTFFHFLFLILIIYGCAQISRPDGGPIDEEPPQFVSSNPENYSILFDTDEIVIQFDEYVKLKNPQQQIIFSPPISPKPQVSPMGVASKQVKIKLALDSLKSNSTYTINFGNSIEDNNEGNPLPFFKYVFSTGDYIDSLQLKGRVKDMNNRISPEFISVLMYEKDSLYNDSVVFKGKPTYVTFVMDSSQNFSLENMRAGTYKLVALEDKNNDYKFNQGREKIGFVEGFINLPTDTIIDFSLFDSYKDFKAERPKQVSKNHIIFGYQGVLDTLDYEIDLLSKAPDSLQYQIIKRRNADTLDYWYNPYNKSDSLIFSFAHQGIKDSLIVKTRDMLADSLQIEVKPKNRIGFEQDFFIRANIPIAKVDTSKIKMFDVDTLPVSYSAKLNNFHNQVRLKFEKPESTSYKMTILPEAIVDMFGNTNDTINVSLRTNKKADFSLLDLTITNLKRYPAIVQLVDDKEKIEKSVVFVEENQHVFENIKPGKYFVKVIYDDNENGKWDSGNFLQQQQAEEVIYNTKTIELRANWDVVEKISLP